MLDPTQKALEINLDARIYGTFAEIGAGQEVARHFFRAGGAAGTIAKSMSAYDMAISDAVYGKSGRYVSLERLQTMLARELDQLLERLQETRGKESSFFVFADTVAAKSYKTRSKGNGWLGVRFQQSPGARPSQVILHVNMLDKANLQQQEALGVLGVNLVHACYRRSGGCQEFVRSLMEGLNADRIEIDMIEVDGQAFEGEDARIWPLELVKQNLCKSIMFNPQGEVLLAKDCLYTKNILICRGSYRPPTLLNMDMLQKGAAAFGKTLDKQERDNILILPEISMNKLRERGKVDNADFLARIELLGILGHHAMVSNYQDYGELSRYLAQCTKKRVAFIFGHYNLQEIFDEKRYASHPAGLLGGIGDLVGQRTNLYCYPSQDDRDKSVLGLDDFAGDNDITTLVGWLRSRGILRDITDYDRNHFRIWSRTVLGMIGRGESGWEEMVPQAVAKRVKKRALFGHPS